MSVQPATCQPAHRSALPPGGRRDTGWGRISGLLGFLVLIAAGWVVPVAAQDSTELPVIKPSDAAQHVDKQVIVEFEVASSSFLKERDMCFLNSLKDHRQEDNFSVVLRKAGLKVFADKEIEDPAKHFLKKKVRVEGKVELYNKKPQIVVTKFEQLKVVGVRPADE
jgi:DNA/RNA endonuclease YhcR with UshA esterase domain